MDEHVYFREGEIAITSTRVQIEGQTFATRNIGSVRMVGGSLSIGGLFFLAIGAAMMGTESTAAGVIIGAAAAAWLWQRWVRREIYIASNSGEIKALRTNDSKLAQRVHDALQTAISVR